MKKVFRVLILTVCFFVSVIAGKAATFTVNSGTDSHDAISVSGVTVKNNQIIGGHSAPDPGLKKRLRKLNK